MRSPMLIEGRRRGVAFGPIETGPMSVYTAHSVLVVPVPMSMMNVRVSRAHIVDKIKSRIE